MSILQLSQVFMNKLDLNTLEALKFARFLVEEPNEEEEQNDFNKIIFEIERKANA